MTTPVVLDFRPLQGGDAGRGIGSTVRGLARCFPEQTVLLWSNKKRPVEAENRSIIAVRGPARSSRMSWLLDGISGRASHLRSRRTLWHLLSADPSFDVSGSYVITVNDTIPWRFPDLYPMGPTGKLWMSLTSRLARRAERVVVPSETSSLDVARYLGVDPERVRVIPWAPDPDLEIERTEGNEHSVTPGKPYVVMAGGFAHHDPRKRFVDAVAALRELPDEVGLIITGEAGPSATHLMAEAEELGVRSRVRLTGFLSPSQMAAVYSGATAFVFPSLWEGFGLPLLNAFALGVPAVVSDGGSLPEIAGDAALVYRAGDSEALGTELAQVVGDPALATDLRDRGHKRVHDFSWETTGEKYRAVYAEVGATA